MKTAHGWFQWEAFMSKPIGRSIFWMIGLLVLVVSGCSTHVQTLKMNDGLPASGSTQLSGPPVILFPVEEALQKEPAVTVAYKATPTDTVEEASQQKSATREAGFKADPTYLGEGLYEFHTLYLIIPMSAKDHEFHADMPRTDMIRTVARSRLKDYGIPATYQAIGKGDTFKTLPEDRLGISMRLRKLDVDTSLTFFLPLIVINIFSYHDVTADVVLDCQLRQAGNNASLWEGTGEGRFTTDDLEKMQKDGGKQGSNVVREAISIAVDQCITRSGLLTTRAKLSSERYARLMTNGNKLATDGNAVKALYAYGQAYGTAMTPEQSLDAVKAMGPLIKVVPGNQVVPEEARKFKVQAEGAIQEKKFKDAADLYREALNVAPWWPDGYFNRALVLGETGEYEEAMREMKFYLQLVPDAPDARAAQDKVYQWERLKGNTQDALDAGVAQDKVHRGGRVKPQSK